MEAPPAKLIGDDSSRRKDKDKGKKKKGKAKDEGKMKMDKKKTKKKKDKANKRSLPAANPLTSHPPLMRGSSSEGEHADGMIVLELPYASTLAHISTNFVYRENGAIYQFARERKRGG